MQAKWNGAVIAESEDTVIVDGNHYFPVESVNQAYLESSSKQTTCYWKGKAHYYNLNVDGQVNQDAVWYYPEPKAKAQNIANHVAFWRGVEVV